MQCRNHPTEKGVNTCNQCGSWLCDRCSFERGGRIFCPGCASQQATGTSAPSSEYTHSSAPHYSGRSISWGLLFLFSIVIPLPGLNYMFLGLIKRGLVAMLAFFGVLYIAIQFFSAGTWQLGLLFILMIPVLILACAFDGFRLRNRMNAGEIVTDNIDDLVNFIRRNRVMLTVFVLLLVAVNVAGSVLPWLFQLLRNVVLILIAVWAIQALFNKPKS